MGLFLKREMRAADRSRKAVSRLYASKAHMNSVLVQMKNELSTEVTKAIQSLVKISSIQGTRQELSKEIMKAGIMEETEEDTFESMDDLEEMVEAADMELIKFSASNVTNILLEIKPPGGIATSEDKE
ncbi:unnamed protein product [Nyctereutes procyonoides]|uniref:(raccoon dog) hypothetical protein n=1 Tax=Nyctereutes procyonoides TaxID=34880 RepID=A0A811Y611_NYCPR|nr:unnamed protein product [Nyctereutes procyonoides]